VERHQDRSDSGRLIAFNDAGFCFQKGACSVQDIQEEIEPYRDTDFGKVFWQIWMGDTSQYLAKVGALFGEGLEDFGEPGARRMAACMQEVRNLGLDPLEVALEHAHGMGLELYATMRMGLFGMHPPAEAFEGPFFRDHPEFRCRDYDGTEVSHLSYAFPEVRQYVLSLLGDAATHDVDGIGLILVRGEPYVLYESPLVEAFQRDTGIDPVALGKTDPRWQWVEHVAVPGFMFGGRATKEDLVRQRCARLDELSPPAQAWLRFRAGALTAFMRDLRGLLQQMGKGQRISAVVFGNEADNLFFGLDVEDWVRQGLVDSLIPYPWPEDLPELDLEFFSRVTEGSGCEVFPNVMPRRMHPREYLQRALHYYEHGADGLAFWDANARHPLLSQWQAVRELGHKEELVEWLETERFPGRYLQLKRLGGYIVDRYHPDSGG
jgi:hypothetical protein